MTTIAEDDRRVIAGVDTHKEFHVVVVLDEQGRKLDTATFARMTCAKRCGRRPNFLNGRACSTLWTGGDVGEGDTVRVRAAVCVVLSVALAGCANWPQFRYGASRVGNNPIGVSVDSGTVSSLTTAWKGETGGIVGSSPAIVDGIVYAGSGDGMASRSVP